MLRAHYPKTRHSPHRAGRSQETDLQPVLPPMWQELRHLSDHRMSPRALRGGKLHSDGDKGKNPDTGKNLTMGRPTAQGMGGAAAGEFLDFSY